MNIGEVGGGQYGLFAADRGGDWRRRSSPSCSLSARLAEQGQRRKGRNKRQEAAAADGLGSIFETHGKPPLGNSIQSGFLLWGMPQLQLGSERYLHNKNISFIL